MQTGKPDLVASGDQKREKKRKNNWISIAKIAIKNSIASAGNPARPKKFQNT